MDTRKPIRASTAVRKRAQELRQERTDAEAILWERLRRRRLKGLKFRRQHPISRFVVDFWCPDFKLIVELDGGIHERQAEYDAARTEELEARGYRVIRFTNEQVLSDLSFVLSRIAALTLPSRCSGTPLPPVGEGRRTK